MSEVVTAEQIEAFRTNGFIVVDDMLTDAELDTFEPLVTAAVAYRSAGDERTLEEPLPERFGHHHHPDLRRGIDRAPADPKTGASMPCLDASCAAGGSCCRRRAAHEVRPAVVVVAPHSWGDPMVQWPGSTRGQGGWALIPVSGFQGAGPVRRGLGIRRVMTVNASASSSLARWEPRQ